MTIDQVFESKPIQASGKAMLLFAFLGGASNLILRMEIIQPTIVIISGILGIIYIVFKLRVIRIDIIERNEKRIAEGKKPIHFRKLRLWKKKAIKKS